MSELLEWVSFVGAAVCVVDLVVRRGSQLVSWLKGAEATVVTDVKKL